MTSMSSPFATGSGRARGADRLEDLAAIRAADPNVAYPAATPTKARSALPSMNEALGAMDIAAAHEQTRGDPAVRIALIDTGLDTTGTAGTLHLVEGRDLVDIDTAAWRQRGYLLDPVEDYVDPGPLTLNRTGHGSILARTIAGPRGVCPQCSVMPLRAGFLARYPGNSDDGRTLVSRFEADDIAAALVHATNEEADIINLSLTVSEPTDVLALGINYAYRRGPLLVGAAGNQGRRPLPYPAAYGHVVAVGAADERGERAFRTTDAGWRF